ncbi:MAG: hypothetical protein PHH84_04425 [Oscillospiraceae bacterium]|nr:hypothetical protein [Oscillospiraceae bacterium]MDD4414173.1 hypothetical protein [Oscillospiraceae bacterium]
MKAFKHLLWFIVPSVIIGVLLYIFTFADAANLPRFVGTQNYLKLFLNNPVLLRALFNAIVLPLFLAIGIGVSLFIIKQFLFRDKHSGIFYSVCFISSSLVFHFTANLKLFMGLPPAAYSSHVIVSSSALLMQPNIPAILISIQVGVIICFIFWCADKITQKLRSKKAGVI